MRATDHVRPGMYVLLLNTYINDRGEITSSTPTTTSLAPSKVLGRRATDGGHDSSASSWFVRHCLLALWRTS